jgi:enoyl-CoA hydratase/carnithine racemase
MPEISIGHYPDAGGTWFLGRMPGKLGLFLALTGAPLDSADALFAGIADHAVRSADKSQLFSALEQKPWTRLRQDNDRILTNLLRSFSFIPERVGPARAHFDRVNNLCGYAALSEIIAAIAALKGSQDPWLAQAAATLANGSPSSAALAYELRRRARQTSLADVFRMELVATMHCAARQDLSEGVRAVLIDKDRLPRWQPASHAEVTQDWIEGYFASPWPRPEHPLANLEAMVHVT